MRAGLGRDDRATLLSVECVFEEHRRDTDLFWCKLVKDEMSVTSAVITTHASMVTPGDKMGVTVVFFGLWRDGVARLKANDPSPASTGEHAPCLGRIVAESGEPGVGRTVEQPDITA